MSKTVYKIPESVLVVIYTPSRQVLLLERSARPGFWQSVTGSKDSVNEALQTTCMREVMEETGIDATLASCELTNWRLVNEYDIYPAWQHRYAPGVTRNTEHVWGLRVPEQQRVRIHPAEHAAWQWLPWREAADCCFSPSNAEAILMLPQFAS
jgi:dihydroneopterin triphosphate diphosphatase